ncbi:unnamed protein product [marine sediment metagenome]|uniref:Uncharacterized protein n=1 Tax=marine sediment metagenome TaxID=412755 RepID=X0Y529_9ZZZZ
MTQSKYKIQEGDYILSKYYQKECAIVKILDYNKDEHSYDYIYIYDSDKGIFNLVNGKIYTGYGQYLYNKERLMTKDEAMVYMI